MKKIPILGENDLQTLLNLTNLDKSEDIDMYFQILDSKLINKKYNLYICKLKDKKTSYDRFIIKSSKNLLNNSVIHVTKVRITLSGKNKVKIISCLNYENFGIIDLEEINKIKEKPKKVKEIEQKEKEEREKEREILGEELNEKTKLLLKNIKHEKKKKKYYFKWDKGNLKLYDIKTNKEKKLSVKKISKKKKSKKQQLHQFNILGEHDDNIINEDDNEKNNEELDDDQKEIEKLFEGIDIKGLLKINEKRDNKKIENEKDFQLFINLSNYEEGKKIYVKCINKQLIIKENQKYIVYIFRDAEGGEINAYTYDNDIPLLNNKIIENGIYIISEYLVKPKIYSTFINNDYSLILNSKTKIQTMPPDSVFNKVHFHFLNIEDLFYFKEGTIVDICGVIYDEGKIEIIKTKYGNKIIRNILICDSSKKKIYVSLWEPHSNNKRIKFEKGEILAIKYGKIILYPEKIKKLSTISLSMIQNSTSDYEKDLELKEFYEKNKNINNFAFVINPPNYKFLEELRNLIIYNIKNNIDNCKINFLTKAYIDEISIDNNCIYNGCPFCHRKLKEIDEYEKESIPKQIKFKCLFCKKNFIVPKYIFKLSFRARDVNAKVFFNMVGDEAKKFLDVEPDIVKEYLKEENYVELKKIEEKVLFQEYIFMGKLVSYPGSYGKIINKAKVDNCEKADGENLKRILQLMEEEGDDDD